MREVVTLEVLPPSIVQVEGHHKDSIGKDQLFSNHYTQSSLGHDDDAGDGTGLAGLAGL